MFLSLQTTPVSFLKIMTTPNHSFSGKAARFSCAALLSLAPMAHAALQAEYFNGRNFDSPAVQRTDGNINFFWQEGSPDPLVNFTDFSARWTGFLKAQYSEPYTIYILSDNGNRLKLNGNLVTDNFNPAVGLEKGWFSGTHSFTAGQRTPFELEYYESTGWAEITLYWESASQPLEIIPASAFSKPDVLGWTARYFDGRQFNIPTVTRVENAIDHPCGPDAPLMFPDNFSAKWSGQFTPTVTENYTFTIAADDGARLWVNGALVFNVWNPGGDENAGWHEVTVPVTAGQPVSILLDYYQGWGGAGALLYGSSASQPYSLLGGPTITTLTSNQAPYFDLIANQTTLIDTRVSLPLIASDAEGDVISFDASGLPPGVFLVTEALELNYRGLPAIESFSLSGRPLTAGAYPVTMRATTADGAQTVRTFLWTVQPTTGTVTLQQALEQINSTFFLTRIPIGFWLSYTVPSALNDRFESRVESSTDLISWTTSTTLQNRVDGNNTIYFEPVNLDPEAPEPRRFWRIVLRARVALE
jgi:PA14 domain